MRPGARLSELGAARAVAWAAAGLMVACASPGPTTTPTAATATASDICRLQDPAAQRLAAYSTAVASRGLVFISGVVPVVPETGRLAGEDLDSQVHRALANLERALALAGATRDDVLKVTVFLKNPADFPAMNRLYAAYFGGKLPARTTVPGADWGNAFLVEIEAVALDRRPTGACP